MLTRDSGALNLMEQMEYFTIQAPSYTEAVAKVQEKYGSRAQILTHRNIKLGGFLGLKTRDGVELTGYLKKDPPKRKSLSLEEEKRRFIEMRGVDQSTVMTQILAEVKSLKSQINEQAVSASPGPRGEHETINRLEELLQDNEFSSKYIKKILQRVKTEFTLEELDEWAEVQDRVLEWIGDSIKIYRHKVQQSPEIFVLVGPTGVGKTTTIAKLAARFGIGASGLVKKKVRIITIDNYRIGARTQIETYGEIMGIPVNCAETSEDLRKFLAFYQDADIIFIDTIGKSPKDYENLGRMRGILKECGSQAQMHLAMSATTKGSDMAEISQQFEPFNYHSIIITKLDETNKVGSLISMLDDKQKSISYIATGQVVPHDIEAASVMKFLLNLEGFRINRDRLEQRFSLEKVE